MPKKKKRWEECGWNRGPHEMPELQPGRDCRDLLPKCVNSGMSPHCSLKLRPSPTHLQETSPHRRKKKKNIIYHVFCFLYSQQNIRVCDGSEERKITLTATLQAENSLLPFSQGCELLTKARVCVPAQGRSTTGLFSVSPTLR